jgi:hypothetical protein
MLPSRGVRHILGAMGDVFSGTAIRRAAIAVVAVLAVLMPVTIGSMDLGSTGFNIVPQPVPLAQSAEHTAEKVPTIEELFGDVKIIELIPDSYIDNPKSNEQIVWNYLLDQGFSDVAAAGIMGNLQQEHRFRTDGDGLAQWTGGRRKALQSRANSGTLSVQLDFMMHELNGGYLLTRNRLYSSTSVEQATLIFMNGYERPGIPAASKRISYAYEIYNKYHRE